MRNLYKIDPRIRYDKIDELINEPKIIRVNEFEEEDLKEFEIDLDEAHSTGQPVIPIIIDSFGGSSYGCLGFVAALESCKIPVATILTSKAMSAGAILFCFGTEGYRFMHEHATLMIHDVGSNVFGKVEEIKADSKHMDQINTMIYKRVSKQLGHDSNYIGDLIKDHKHIDWFLTSKEAKKHNIANHIRIPQFETKISMKINFI